VANVKVILVPDNEYVDEENDSGLTEEGFETLSDAMAEAGFTILTGPDKTTEGT
jgi:hypothetical protein